MAAGWTILFIIHHHKNIGKVYTGDASNALIIILLLEIIIIPIAYVLMGLYFGNIRITTNTLEIEYNSIFNKTTLPWDKFNTVKRVGRRIKLTAANKSFLFSPFISANNIAIKHKPKENTFQRCDLLREIHLKAINAEFKGFPENTFIN